MIRLEVHPDNPQVRYIGNAVDALEKGGLICYPTDTIYGIGCDIFNKKAIAKIYQLKGKNYKSPLSFIVPNLKDIAKFAHVSTPAYKLMKRYLPGPYTFVLEATKLVPKIMLSKRRTVGIRIPDDNVCLMLLKEFANPIVSTSTSLNGIEVTNDPEDIAKRWGHAVEIFLDSGPSSLEPSTVIDLTGTEPVVLRKGKGFDDLIF